MAPFYADIDRRKPLPYVISEMAGKITLLSAGNRRGERGAMAFFEEMVNTGALVGGDVVVTDNERCWTTELVEDFLSSNGIAHLLYPKYLGAFLDPCDNSFHSRFRHAYNKAMLGKEHVGLEDRLKILCKVYRATPTKQVKAFIRHCGLFEGNPEHAMHELMCEGRGVLGKKSIGLSRSIQAYLQFQKETDFSEPDEVDALKHLHDAPMYHVRKPRKKQRK